jgi:hypothetical protein
MSTTIIIAIVAVASCLAGVSIGFGWGITKGFELGIQSVRRGPPSPIPWILCLIASGLMVLGALASSAYTIYFLSHSTQAQARVTDIVERKDEDGHVSRFPVYEYLDTKGAKHEDRASSADGRQYEVGDVIAVRYLPATPHDSRIDYFSHHWGLPIALLAGAAFMGAAGFALRWWRQRPAAIQ